MSKFRTSALGLSAAVALIAGYEGLSHTVYKDIGGVETFCYGETEGVIHRVYTTKECDELLTRRVDEFAKKIDPLINVPLSQSQRASILSLSYNIGVNAFKDSTALKKINQGDIIGGCLAFIMWRKVNGKTVEGLINRRVKEAEMCLRG